MTRSQDIAVRGPAGAWFLAPSGVFIPRHAVIGRRPRSQAARQLKYWKVQPGARDLLGLSDGADAAKALLARCSMVRTVDVLVRAALMLANTPYPQTMSTQRFLAPAFFDEPFLKKVDTWITQHDRNGDTYLFSDKQLLIATILALSAPRTPKADFPNSGSLSWIGDALLHVVNDFNEILTVTPDKAPTRSPEERRLLVEFVLRAGFWGADDDHRYAISRYEEMFSSIAPALKDDPEYVDVLRIFRRVTGLRLRTYLAMGLALLTVFHSATTERSGIPAFVSRRRVFRQSPLHRVGALFFREVSSRRRTFLQSIKRDVRMYGNPAENFLEAERHPLVCIGRDSAYCVNLRFLERKFASGVHHIVFRGCSADERLRYLPFFGRVFERYVGQVCASTFGDRFVPSFKYGQPEREAGDGWIIYPQRAILLEAKSTRFSVPVRLSGDLGQFEEAFRNSVVRAARQLHRVINDFRAGQFQVAGFGHAQLPRIIPVVITLDHVPLDHFLSQYLNDLLNAEALLSQPGVAGLTLLSIKNVEHIEGAIGTGANFADLIEERLNSNVWRTWPFSNFMVDRFPGGFNVSKRTVERYQRLLRHSALAVLNAKLQP
jgi:hypothetical protein